MLIKYSKLLIMGSGPSGYTVSIYSCRSNLNPILITGNQLGGQLINSNLIENWPSIVKITGNLLMENFLLQVKNFNIEISYNEIYKCNLFFKPIKLLSINNIYYLCEILSISSGAFHNKIKLIKNVKNVSFCGVCDGNIYKKKNILLLGGGYTAIYNCIYLSKIVNKLFLVHRNNTIKSDYFQIKNFFFKKKEFKFIIKLNSILLEFISNNFTLKYIKIKNILNGDLILIYLSGFFYFIGNIINSKFCIGQVKTKKNSILNLKKKNFNFSITSLNGIFCSGDIHDYIYKQAIISSGYGAISSLDILNFFNIYI